MFLPKEAATNHKTERLLEVALVMLDTARREQDYERMPIINNWLTNNFTLKIIRAKVAASKANAIIDA
jgi:hypothetical protein